MAVGNASLATIPAINIYLIAILQNFVAFVGAAGLVVALKVALASVKA
jgi:hypothetical protein